MNEVIETIGIVIGALCVISVLCIPIVKSTRWYRVRKFGEMRDSHGKPWTVKHPEWYDEYGRLIKDFGSVEDDDPFSCEGLGQWCD